MCLAIPMKVVAIQGDTAQVDQAGARKEIRIDLMDDLQVGDYVLVHAGFAISKIDPQEAEKTLELWEEIGQ